MVKGKEKEKEIGGPSHEGREKEKEIAGPSDETQISIAAWSSFPGFRFSPTDVELISYYLKKKMEGCEKCVEVISELEICRYEPSDLPAKAVIQSPNEWFFFSARGRKYPNGSQSRRATEHGYWKATGKERNVKSGSDIIGTKRTLVFHRGRAPKGERTEWIMHEYCMYGKSQDTPVICRLRRNSEFCLNDASNRTAVTTSQGTAMGNSNQAGLDGDADQTCGSGGDEAATGDQARKTSSSYDSHSVEQLHSTSESTQKLVGKCKPAQVESSNLQKNSDEDEDLYADILREDIIKLDKSAIPASSNVLMVDRSGLEAKRESQQPMEALLEPALFPCTANPRIKFSEQNFKEQVHGSSSISSTIESLRINNDVKEYNAKNDKWSKWLSFWLPSHLGTASSSGKTSGLRQKVAAIMAVFLVMLAIFLLGSSGR
ncbi:hypothetical protein SAY87_028629 [Trapa incisa]|uniref:NAC domain-containing protein n=1 Tax=Trapa incisa TaxID=236973 RepID=A0AAN7KV85_9MYRT|nr:hypothetical protein SAY87_028629 [Trapa incisa]